MGLCYLIPTQHLVMPLDPKGEREKGGVIRCYRHFAPLGLKYYKRFFWQVFHLAIRYSVFVIRYSLPYFLFPIFLFY
jgi:hypothetical protein